MGGRRHIGNCEDVIRFQWRTSLARVPVVIVRPPDVVLANRIMVTALPSAPTSFWSSRGGSRNWV